MQEVWKGKRSESTIHSVSLSSVCEADITNVPGRGAEIQTHIVYL